MEGEENLELTIYATHVMDKRWNPLDCHLKSYPFELDRALPDYPKKKREFEQLDSLNNQHIEGRLQPQDPSHNPSQQYFPDNLSHM